MDTERLKALRKKNNRQIVFMAILTFIVLACFLFTQYVKYEIDDAECATIYLRSFEGNSIVFLDSDCLNFWYGHHLSYGGYRPGVFSLRNHESGFDLIGFSSFTLNSKKQNLLSFDLGVFDPTSELRFSQFDSTNIFFGIGEDNTWINYTPNLHFLKNECGSINMTVSKEGSPRIEFNDKHENIIFEVK